MKPRKSHLTFQGVAYDGLIDWTARRLIGRAKDEGLDLDFRDVRQEMAILWVHCTRKFDQAHGVKFSTYFVRAADHEYTNACRSLLGRNFRQTSSLNAKVGGRGEGYDECELQDLMQDESADDPETHAIRGQEVERTVLYDPVVQQLFRLTVSPDEPEIQRELEALRHQVEFSKRIGQPMPQPPTTVTPGMLGRMFKLNWRQRQRMLNALGTYA